MSIRGRALDDLTMITPLIVAMLILTITIRSIRKALR
jgi:hypothetical protein